MVSTHPLQIQWLLLKNVFKSAIRFEWETKFPENHVSGWVYSDPVYVLIQLYLTLCDLMDCSPPDSSVHGIFQARVLKLVAISYSRGPSRPGVESASPASPPLAGGFFTMEPPGNPNHDPTRLQKQVHTESNNIWPDKIWILERYG